MNSKILYDAAVGLEKGNENKPAMGIIWAILAILLVAVLAWIIWKVVKGKVQKRKLQKIEQKKQIEDRKKFYEYVITINQIILYTEKELEKFVVSIGETKMREIRDGSKKLIKKLIERDDFASTFVNNEQYTSFVEQTELLCVTNANLWDKKIPETIAYFKDQFKTVPESDRKEECIVLSNESIERQFYEKN